MPRQLGICGSYRRGATYAALEAALAEAAKIPGVETKLLELRNREIHACIGCNRCLREKVNDCLSFDKDDMREVFDSFLQADGYIIASPVYSMGITPILASAFSRFRPNMNLSLQDHDLNLRKVGGAIAVGGTRNGGEETTIAAIHGFYHTKGITIVNGGFGAYSGGAVWSQDGGAAGVKADTTGMEHVQAMGRRVAKAAIMMEKGSK